MSFDSLEIRWRKGAREYTLVIGEDGVPRFDPPVSDEHVEPRPGPARRGKLWTDEEEAAVLQRFVAIEDAAAIAETLGRSRASVVARAVKLGLVTEEEAGLRYPVSRPPDA